MTSFAQTLQAPGPLGGSCFLSTTRPGNVTPYTAGDVYGGVGGGVLPFAGLSAGAGEYMITTASLEIDVTAVPTGMTNFSLWLYNVTPPSALADNAVFDLASGDRAAFQGMGYIDFPAMVKRGASTLYCQINGLTLQYTALSTTIYGYLVTNAGFTSANSSEVFKLNLHTMPC